MVVIGRALAARICAAHFLTSSFGSFCSCALSFAFTGLRYIPLAARD
jgi:hypothetical protein